MSSDPVLLQELKTQVMSFRVAELQMLLGFAQKNRSGKKHELQARAINLLQRGNLTLSVQNKIRELHRQRFASNNSDSQGSDISSSCYGGGGNSSKGGSSSTIGVNSLPQSSTPGGPNRVAPPPPPPSSSSSILNNSSISSGDYYHSMPRGLGFEYGSSASSPSTPKPYMSSPVSSLPAPLPYPVLADVKFKILPFFDILGDLLKPATLMPTPNSRFQESNFSFHLTPQQANEVSLSRDVKPDGRVEHGVQIQMRFCLMETSCEQEDNFPPSICVKVNSKMCQLPNPLATNKPGIEPKRPSRPVNITTLCRISPTATNQISISWASEYNRAYAIGVFLVKRLTSSQLLQRVKSKGIRNCEYTRAMIKEKLAQDPDSEIATMILRGSLLCPLGKMKIQIPCRATTCSHIQCFDGLLYLQMNEKKPTWICPVCDKSALFQHLVIDGLFTEIINQAPLECTEVQFHEDGSWTPILPKKESFETVSVNHANKRPKEEPCSPTPKKKKHPDIEIITLDSSDEEEDEEDEDDDDDDEDDDNALQTKHSASLGHSTPVLSSGSSSTSETPNMSSLPSPDSSTGSSFSPNINHNSDVSTNSRPVPGNSYSTTTQCYGSSSNTRSGINPVVGINSGPPSIGTRGRSSLGNLACPLSRSNNVSSSSSSYTGMPLLNPNTPPFYPSSTTKPYSDPFISNPPPHSMPYSNFDMFYNHNHSLFNGDIPRELTSYRSGSSSSGPRASTDSAPELISLD